MEISVKHDVVKHHSIMVSQVLTYHLTLYQHGLFGFRRETRAQSSALY